MIFEEAIQAEKDEQLQALAEDFIGTIFGTTAERQRGTEPRTGNGQGKGWISLK